MADRDDAIRCVNPLNDPEWDAKLAACPGASFFHGAAWARVLHETYRFTPSYIISGNSATARSVLPLMEVNSWLTGRRGVSLPFTDECEPVCAGASAFDRMARAAIQCAELRHWRYWELRGGRQHLGAAPAAACYHGHTLDLHPDVDALYAGLDGATRRAVRKAGQAGLRVEFSRGIEAVRSFYNLLCKTRKRHGVPPQPFRFFESIHRHVLAPNQGCIVLATLGDTAVAGAVFFHFGRTVLYKYGASDDSFLRLRPNNLVMWRAIEWHARAGYERLDFGRTSTTNEGLRRFKLGWGARERLIEYLKYDRRARRFVAENDESAGWQTRLFKVLPSSLSRLIGAAAYKHAA